jgi:hypothetical protein
MVTLTQVTLTCDVCGTAKDVQTWTFGLCGETYETDLCPKDGKGLSKVAAEYIKKARKVTAGRNQRPNGSGPRSRTATEAAGSKAKAAGPKEAAKAGRSQPREAAATSRQAAEDADVRQDKGIYVYGILPADIEVAADTPGVGEHPGLLRVVRSGGLAALISEVDLSGPPGSPDDLRTHREILDATAAEVPVLPLSSGTILPSEDAVAKELLDAHHDEFAAALEQLEGRAEFLVKGRYVEGAALDGTSRDDDTRTLGQAMREVCVDSVVRESASELDAVDVALLVAVDEQSEVEQVIEDLAHEWAGRIDVRLLGPMAAYDFVGTADPES